MRNLSSGYIGLRRGFLEHLMDGRVSLNEFTVFTILLMRADITTGIALSSAPTLCGLMRNGMTVEQAKRALQGLNDGDYLMSGWKRGMRGDYPILLNRYNPVTGSHKGKFVDVATSESPTKPSYVTADVTSIENVARHLALESPIETRVNASYQTISPVETQKSPSNARHLARHSEEKSPIETPTYPNGEGVVARHLAPESPVIIKKPIPLKKTTPTPVVVDTTEVNRTEEQRQALVDTCYKLAGQTTTHRLPARLAAKLGDAIAEYGADQLSACLTYAATTPYWQSKFKEAKSPVAFFLGSVVTLSQQSKPRATPVASRGEYVSPAVIEERVQAVYREWLPSCSACSGAGEVPSAIRPGKMAICPGCKVKLIELRAEYR